MQKHEMTLISLKASKKRLRVIGSWVMAK